MNKSENDFASAVKGVRLARKMNLQQFADEIGVNRATIFRYESGKMVPDTGVVFRLLASALKTEESTPFAATLAEYISSQARIRTDVVLLSAMPTMTGAALPSPAQFRKLLDRAQELLK